MVLFSVPSINILISLIFLIRLNKFPHNTVCRPRHVKARLCRAVQGNFCYSGGNRVLRSFFPAISLRIFTLSCLLGEKPKLFAIMRGLEPVLYKIQFAECKALYPDNVKNCLNVIFIPLFPDKNSLC